jgi:ribosomal-protein-alanine N-acetyltransferase
MPTRNSSSPATGFRVHLRPPRQTDAAAFLAASRASRKLHGHWAKAPATRAEFTAFVNRYGGAEPHHAGFLVLHNDDGSLVGVYNFSQIIRNAFQSAYLGYYAFAPFAGGGYMADGLAVALDIAFRRLKLHRVEVNVQPTNRRSVALVERLSFTREGHSRRYVKIAGRWRDHVRFAMLAEDWRARRTAVRRKLARAAQ